MSACPEAPASTIRELCRQATDVLKDAGVENPIREAEWLLAPVLGVNSAGLFLKGNQRVPPHQGDRAWSQILRRAAREPLQYLLGTQEFWGLDMLVTPDVLIPRPETEILVEEALLAVAGLRRPVIADVGTGSGCIAVSVARSCPDAIVYALDISGNALAIARSNTIRHGMRSRVRFIQSDLLTSFSRSEGALFDVVVSNPPYIPERDLEGLQPEVSHYEPRQALAAGTDGLLYHRRLLQEAPPLLRQGGRLVLELGCGQAQPLLQMARLIEEFSSVVCREDKAGIQRVLIARKAA